MLKDIPTQLNASILEECWNFFKSQTNILKLTHSRISPQAKNIISQGSSNSINKFYADVLTPIFKVYLETVKLFEQQIGTFTSVNMRFTLNQHNSEQLFITIIPSGKWWILKVPTQSNKMDKWMNTLIKNNIIGKCCMVEIYSVIHPEKSIIRIRN